MLTEECNFETQKHINFIIEDSQLSFMITYHSYIHYQEVIFKQNTLY